MAINLFYRIIPKKETSKQKAEAKMITVQADSLLADNYKRLIALLEKRIANYEEIVHKLEMENTNLKTELQNLKAQNAILKKEAELLKKRIEADKTTNNA